MKNYMIFLAFTLGFATLATADHGVVIKKPHKVEINIGMSEAHKIKAMKCLLLLKKHDTAEAAMAAKSEKIQKKCEEEEKELDKKKCDHIKKMVAKHIYHCFTISKFIHEFFGKGHK